MENFVNYKFRPFVEKSSPLKSEKPHNHRGHMIIDNKSIKEKYDYLSNVSYLKWKSIVPQMEKYRT